MQGFEKHGVKGSALWSLPAHKTSAEMQGCYHQPLRPPVAEHIFQPFQKQPVPRQWPALATAWFPLARVLKTQHTKKKFYRDMLRHALISTGIP